MYLSKYTIFISLEKTRACRKGLFLSDDESDLKEEQVSNDLPIVIPTRKANPSTKTRQNLIIPNKDVPVRPHAIKRDIPETTRPPSKRMRHIFRQKRLRHHLESSYMSPSLWASLYIKVFICIYCDMYASKTSSKCCLLSFSIVLIKKSRFYAEIL